MLIDHNEIVVNGKFLLAPLEGMPRVGREVTSALDALLDEPGYRDLRFRVLTPKGGATAMSLRNIPVEEVASRQGLGWEQIDLPRHLRGRYSLNFTSTAPLTKRRGCVIVHDAQFRSTPASHSAKSRLLYGIVTPIVARSYQTVVTISQYARAELARYGVTDREDIRVIPNGADHMLARREDPAILTRLGLVAGGYFLANSYVHDHKNVRVLFDALAAAAGAPKLVLFGTSEADAYARRGIAIPDTVVFAGRVSDEALVALMRNAAAFLFPSTTEGFGLPPLEAMMLDCPTICAKAGAMPEVCGDGAWYAPPHDGTAWRKAMDRLVDDPAARRALGRAGRARAEGYRWRSVAQQYFELLREEVKR